MSCLPSALVSLPNVTDTNAPLPISISTTMAAEYYKITKLIVYQKNTNVMVKNGTHDRNPLAIILFHIRNILHAADGDIVVVFLQESKASLTCVCLL